MEADYVIIGSGSAGSALAYRLSEAGHKVIIIEYGGSDRGPLIQMPGALSYPMNMKRYDWGFVSEAEPHLGNRKLACPRGKVIGGSSSINGMIYVRGNPMDYQTWEEMGATGWGWSGVEPYFRKMENWHADGWGGDPALRGHDGPLHVTRGRRKNELFTTFIKAGKAAGYPETKDYNGAHQEGFGPFDRTIWKGKRWSAADAYLKPALRRENCQLVRAFAKKIIIQNNRATGVEIEHNGKTEIITARAEVILSASAINTPKILMLSGIGEGAHLQEHGIEVISNRPGVGQNLQDHLEVYIQQASLKPVTLYKYWNIFGKAWVGANWLFFKRGPGASNQFGSAAFLRTSDAENYPDIQFHFLPIAVRYDGQAAAEGHGYQAHVGPMRSPSRGSVRLRSSDPWEKPKIQFNYMSTEKDWRDFRYCVCLAREIFAQTPFDPYRGKEIQPGADLQSDEQLDDFIRAHAESAYHPCGTARIGAAKDKSSVIDPHCRVIGVEGLRVADSSIFPQITNGNLNAPSIMTGEKAADLILKG